MKKRPFRKVTLPNGLRVILAPRPDTLVASVLVLVEAGMEYESKELNGVSHFLEHMMFKGTEKRPRPDMIAAELDALGAQYNAFTAAESTCYYAKAERHKISRIIDLLADIYLNPIFSEQEIEKERGVMVQEINMYEDSPSEYVARLFPELLYGDQPAGWKMEDEKRIISTLSRKDFLNYRTAHYVAPKTIVVVAGGFDEAAALKQIKELFGKLPKAKVVKKPKVLPSPVGPQVKFVKRNSSQSHFILGMRAFPFNDPRRPALKTLCNILGGGMSSRLWLRVREELGAAYEVSAFSEMHSDHGSCAIFIGSEHEKFDKVLTAILEEMRRLTSELVPPEELQKAKDHMIGNFILGLEASDDLAEYYAFGEVRAKELTPPDEVIKRIQGVTREQVRDVARTLFRKQNFHFVMVGPKGDPEAIRRRLA